MSVSTNASNITRQELLEEYQRSPESAPLKRPALVYTTATEAYRFERLMARIGGATAAELIDAANRDAATVTKGCRIPLTVGIIVAIAGMAGLIACPAFPLLLFLCLPSLYFGTNWIRSGNDKIRRAKYDRRFAADVARYASALAGRTRL